MIIFSCSHLSAYFYMQFTKVRVEALYGGSVDGQPVGKLALLVVMPPFPPLYIYIFHFPCFAFIVSLYIYALCFTTDAHALIICFILHPPFSFQRIARPDKYTDHVLVCTPGSIANELMAVKRRRLDAQHIKVCVCVCVIERERMHLKPCALSNSDWSLVV